MGEQVNTAWPVVGQSSVAIIAHACNLKSEIQELLVYSKSLSEGDATVAEPIPYDVFKSVLDSVLTFIDKVLDQPSLKDLSKAIEHVNQTTNSILADVQAIKRVQGGHAAATTATAPAAAAAQAAATTVVVTEQPADLPEIPPQMAAAMKNMSPNVAEKTMEPRRRGQAALQARVQAAEGGAALKVAPLHVTARPAGIKATAIAQEGERTSKLVLESQNTKQENVHDKIYTTLTTTKREIRLVKLLPEPDPDYDIRCELSKVSLDTRPVYKALSYTWGDPNDTVSIILDGHRFAVTRNLKKALQRLRTFDRETPLWIDAICINQVNTTERMQQVQLMRVIFESPSEVVVWLGDAPPMTGDELWDDTCFSWRGDESDVPRINSIMTFAESFADTFPEKSDPRSANPLVLSFCLMRLLAGDVHMADMPLLRNPKLRSICISEFGKLVRQPWWNRIWVVQEVILPSTVTLVFGRFMAPLRMYTDASSNLRRHMSSCCASVIPTDRNTVAPIENFCRKLLEIGEAGNLWSKKDNLTLLNLLEHFYLRDATDSRDKIYGLLSLVTDWGNGAAIAPDYTISPSQLYQEVALRSIEVSGSLAILCYRSHQDYLNMTLNVGKIVSGVKGHEQTPKTTPEPVELEFPSWTVDWKNLKVANRSHISERLNRTSIFDACAGRPATPAPLRYTCSPVLTRTRVHTVSAVHVGTISHYENLKTILINQFAAMNADEFPVPSKPDDLLDQPYVTVGNEYDALWRTMCADSFFVGSQSTAGLDRTLMFRRATQDDLKAVQAWRRWIGRVWKGLGSRYAAPQTDSSSSEEDRLIADADRAIRSASLQRSFFKMANGYMGLAPLGATRGDEIFVLLGNKMPYVLRPLGKIAVEGLGEHRCYVVIGECHVQGIMDGELVKKPRIEVQELCLI